MLHRGQERGASAVLEERRAGARGRGSSAARRVKQTQEGRLGGEEKEAGLTEEGV